MSLKGWRNQNQSQVNVTAGQITSVTLTSGGGYIAPPHITITGVIALGDGGGKVGYNTWQGFGSNRKVFALNNDNNEEIFHISADGAFYLNDSANKVAKQFAKALNGYIDIEAAGKQALVTTYKRAIERCLHQIKSMDKDSFITMLENEIETRTAQEMLMYLKEAPDPIEEEYV